MAGNVLIYIDDSTIRVMETRGRRITKVAEAMLDMGMAAVTDKVKEAEIVTKIKHILKENNITNNKVTVGISGMGCLSRPAILPKVPPAMMDEAVMREAKRVLPVPPEQLYISWQKIKADDEKIQVFILAVPRQVAENIIHILRQVGLKPVSMDIKPMALSRLVMEPTAIVLDVQKKEFDIVVMAGGIPQPVRTVSFAQENMSLQERLIAVKDELERTVQFHNDNNKNNMVDETTSLYLSGEPAGHPEIYDMLSKMWGYQVLPLVSPLKCAKNIDTTYYPVNIGLALKGRKDDSALLADINVLPAEYLPKQLSLVKIVAPVGIAMALMLMVTQTMVIRDTYASINSVSNIIESSNYVLKHKQEQQKELQESIAALEEQLAAVEKENGVIAAAFNRLDTEGDRINADLNVTVDSLVEGVSLSRISISEKAVNIQGETLSEVEILQYARNLDESGRFAEVTISSLSRSQGDIADEEEEEQALPEEYGDSDVMGFTLNLRVLEGL